MSRLFLFAIGGTGARVVRSLTMMLASGINGLDSQTEIVPIIMDYDLSNEDKRRAIDALKTYSEIYDCLYKNRDVTYNDHFFMTKLTPLKNVAQVNNGKDLCDYEFYYGLQQGQNMTFSEWLDLSNMKNAELKQTRDLMYALYDSSDNRSPDAELELNMTKGFKGNPNIGAVVYHGLKNTSEFKLFESQFNPNVDKVFIISSIFGGTGSSGFPEIVKAIRGSSKSTAIIGADIILPYFGLQQPSKQNEIETGAIDASSFNGKSRAALAYYASDKGINTMVDGIYYTGDKEEYQDAYEYHEGANSQKNDAHIVEFIAAAAVIDFMKKNWQQHNNNPNAGQCAQAFEFSVNRPQDGSAIKLNNFFDSTHNLILDYLSTFAIAMKFYRDVVCGDRSKTASETAFLKRFNLTAGTLQSGLYRKLNDFLGKTDDGGIWGFYGWLEELKNHNSQKLYLYNMDNEKEMKEILSYKEVKGRLFNPMKDNSFREDINKKSCEVKNDIGYELQFLKVLRDVAKEKYNKVK